MGLADDIRNHANEIKLVAKEQEPTLANAGEHLIHILSLYKAELSKIKEHDAKIYEREVTRLMELVQKVEATSNWELRKDPRFS